MQTLFSVASGKTFQKAVVGFVQPIHPATTMFRLAVAALVLPTKPAGLPICQAFVELTRGSGSSPPSISPISAKPMRENGGWLPPQKNQ